MGYVLKSRTKGFTLVETIIAVLITSLALMTIFASSKIVLANQKRQENNMEMDFEQFITILYSDDLNLIYGGPSEKPGRWEFYSLKNGVNYSLRYDHNKLWLLKQGRGYMPLMFDVDEFHLRFNKQTMRLALEVKACGRSYKQTVVIDSYLN